MKPINEHCPGLAPTLALALASVLMLLLNGCRDAGPGDVQDILNEMDATASGAEPALLPGPVADTAVGYRFDDRRSPFEMPGVPPQAVAAQHSDITPDGGRRAEPLEAFALDELMLVGTLTFNGSSSALVRAPTGKVHRLSVGSHMGADFGRITEITASAVQLVETVPAGGGWVERASILVLGD